MAAAIEEAAHHMAVLLGHAVVGWELVEVLAWKSDCVAQAGLRQTCERRGDLDLTVSPLQRCSSTTATTTILSAHYGPLAD